MPPGLSDSPATFNRLETQLFHPHHAYAHIYFDDIFVHSQAEQGRSDVDNHIDHCALCSSASSLISSMLML